MVNAASGEYFRVELVGIVEGVRLTDPDLFGEETGTTVSDVLCFHVENAGDEARRWWADEHYFVGSDGFQYVPEDHALGFGGTAEELPAHWYPSPEVQPGRRVRCVAELPDTPSGVTVKEIIYDYEDEHYEIDLVRSELDDDPL
jgi:hypothetical protein